MTRTSLISIALLSAWLAITLCMWFVATRSFRNVDRVLSRPSGQFEQMVQTLSQDRARASLRFVASELNRTLFRAYGFAQIALGALLFILVWRATTRDTTALALAGVMLALALVLTFVIQPQIVALGRTLDFLPRTPAPPQMSRFWMLHGAFTGLDGAKLLAGAVLLVRWVVKR
ncbi:MAG TPA: DUF4149 domain-containing protein [Terriglobia bacterium]|nr:DUF4149 domain-containing protein [Terriglobia bacterium]